jgi:hypothetical protein
VLFSRTARQGQKAVQMTIFFRVIEENFGELAEWLTEQSKIAKERPSHEGDPKGETRSVE